MAFKILASTPSAAVANGGTLAFTLGSAAEWGQVKYQGGHSLYAEGLQAQFNFPKDFSLSAIGATVTVTYNGTTSIPANTTVKLQLETAGEDNYRTLANETESVSDSLKNVRAVRAKPYRVLLGAPAAASATAILAATAVANGNLVTLATAYVNDVPRGVQIASSNVGDITQTVTIRGTDELGNALTEVLTANGTTAVNGKKAFKTIISYQASAAFTGNLTIGNTNVLGLPCFLDGGTGAGSGYVLKEIMDAAAPTAGTFVGGDLTLATGTTGDVRGTYTPNTAPNGTHIYELVALFTDLTFKGVAQYAG